MSDVVNEESEVAATEQPAPSKWRRLRRAIETAWRQRPKLDRWDRIGLCGLALISIGIGTLVGWRWAALASGVLLLTFYYLGEIKAGAAPRKQGG